MAAPTTTIVDTSPEVPGPAPKVWIDPVCIEIAVEELTAAGGPGVTDSGILS